MKYYEGQQLETPTVMTVTGLLSSLIGYSRGCVLLCSVELNSKLQRKVISFLVDKSFAIFSIIIENRPTWNHPMNNFFLIFNWTIFLVIDSWHCFSDPFLYCLSHYDLYLLCLYKYCNIKIICMQEKEEIEYSCWELAPGYSQLVRHTAHWGKVITDIFLQHSPPIIKIEPAFFIYPSFPY